MAALEQAYQNQKMVGKFPACVLHVEVKLSQVDVNVHPAKTEVKFCSEREVFNAVYHAVLSVLEGDRSHPQATFSPARPKQTPGQTTMPGLSAQTYRQLTVADVAAPRFTPKPRPTWTPPPAAATGLLSRKRPPMWKAVWKTWWRKWTTPYTLWKTLWTKWIRFRRKPY